MKRKAAAKKTSGVQVEIVGAPTQQEFDSFNSSVQT